MPERGTEHVGEAQAAEGEGPVYSLADLAAMDAESDRRDQEDREIGRPVRYRPWSGWRKLRNHEKCPLWLKARMKGSVVCPAPPSLEYPED